MKTVILCGGRGQRLQVKTQDKPKPLVEVGGKPVMWHVMKVYAAHGYTDFVLPLGYKADAIRRYVDEELDEDWTVEMRDTGLDTLTGGRLQQVRDLLDDQFMMTYSDGVADIDISELVRFHEEQDVIGTVTGVRANCAYGLMHTDNGTVTSYEEKPELDGLVNGGFMVFDPEVWAYIGDGMVVSTAIPALAADGQLAAYHHTGYWDSLDTYKDYKRINDAWNERQPWKVWD